MLPTTYFRGFIKNVLWLFRGEEAFLRIGSLQSPGDSLQISRRDIDIRQLLTEPANCMLQQSGKDALPSPSMVTNLLNWL